MTITWPKVALPPRSRFIQLRQRPQDQTGDPVVVGGGGGDGGLHRRPVTRTGSRRLPGRASSSRGDRATARLISSAAATSRGAGDLISHIPSRTAAATGRHWAASLTAATADDDDATEAAEVELERINHVSAMTDDRASRDSINLLLTSSLITSSARDSSSYSLQQIYHCCARLRYFYAGIYTCIKRWFFSVCSSVAYIANNSRTRGLACPNSEFKKWCDSHASFKVKRSKIKVTRPINSDTHRALYLPNGKAYTNFKRGIPMEDNDPHHPQAPWPPRSKVKVAKSWPNAVPVSFTAGGGIPCLPNPAATLLVFMNIFIHHE